MHKLRMFIRKYFPSKGNKPLESPFQWRLGIDHIAINVPDMEQAVLFFKEVLGCRELFRMKEFVADRQMIQCLGLHSGTIMKDHRMLILDGGTQLSLFQYESPDSSKVMPMGSDLGGYHIAIRVKDMDTALSRIKKQNCDILGEPLRFDSAPNEGIVCAYFRSPWGLLIEFVYYPEDKMREERA